jgi:hypothetical protein
MVADWIAGALKLLLLFRREGGTGFLLRLGRVKDEAKRFGSFEVDDQLIRCWLLHR